MEPIVIGRQLETSDQEDLSRDLGILFSSRKPVNNLANLTPVGSQLTMPALVMPSCPAAEPFLILDLQSITCEADTGSASLALEQCALVNGDNSQIFWKILTHGERI